MGLMRTFGGHPAPRLASAGPSPQAFSLLQMAHESTVEHGRLDTGEAGMALAPWLTRHSHPGQQVGGRGQRGMGVPAAAPPCRWGPVPTEPPPASIAGHWGPPRLQWGGGG